MNCLVAYPRQRIKLHKLSKTPAFNLVVGEFPITNWTYAKRNQTFSIWTSNRKTTSPNFMYSQQAWKSRHRESIRKGKKGISNQKERNPLSQVDSN